MSKRTVFFAAIGFLLAMSIVSARVVPQDRAARRSPDKGILPRRSFAPVSSVSSLVVTNNNDTVNGDTSSPDALAANPGSDGISLREAMLAAQGATKSLAITFDPSLKGAVISVTDGLPDISKGRLNIKGDIDADGDPDITIDGGKTATECFYVRSSDVWISGFIIKNFTSIGIDVTANSHDGVQRVGRVTLLGNTISVKDREGIRIASYDRDRTIENVDVLQNRLFDSYFGVQISAGFGAGFAPRPCSNNRVINVTIRNNTITNNFIAIIAGGAITPGSKNNVLSDLEISDNTIQGHPDTSVLLGGGADGTEGNRVEHLFIRNNYIESPTSMCGIEVGAGCGEGSKDNHFSHMIIEGNFLDKGSILLNGASKSESACNNLIDNVLINRNTILGCAYQGFTICAGGAGARNNTVEKVKFTNNLIAREGGAGILLSGGAEKASFNAVKDITILNNTLVYNGNKADWAGGINIQNDNNSTGNVVSGVKIANTILWKNHLNDSVGGTQSPASVRNCILADTRYRGSNGNFYASPQFVNQAKSDYRLLATSPAIDKGAASGADAGDFDLAGYPRVVDGNGDGTAVADIGAYERQKRGVHFYKLTIASDTHGRTDPGTGVYYLPAGAKITLKALPKAGNKFRKWSGGVSSLQNPLTITMNGSKTINANFKIIVTASPAGKN